MRESLIGKDVRSVMGTRQPRPRREYTAEFKREVADLYLSGERSVAQICNDFELGDTAVRRWIEQAGGGKAAHDSNPLSNAERQELEGLRKENTTLRIERDILKRATAFFAKETR